MNLINQKLYGTYLFILTIILLLTISLKSHSQGKSFESYQSFGVGFDYYYGYEKIGDAFSFKNKNTNLLIESAYIPNISISHNFSQKGIVSLKLGYGFMQSANVDTIINSKQINCNRKLNDLKLDLVVSYAIISSKTFGFYLSGEIGWNGITEKIDCIADNKYSKFGYGIGAGLTIKKGVLLGMVYQIEYYRIGESVLLGGGFIIPIFNNK